MESALDVLHRLLLKGNSPLSSNFKRYKLSQEWERVVGKAISDVSAPYYITNGILTIWVKSGPWMQQLFFVRQEILKRVQEHLNDNSVKTLRFTLLAQSDSSAPPLSVDPQDIP